MIFDIAGASRAVSWRMRIHFSMFASLFFLSLTPARGESFEAAPPGPLATLDTSLGTWSAEAGHAAIHTGRAKSGEHSLRILGDNGVERSVVLTLPAETSGMLSFHAERWTVRPPFSFRIDAKTASGEWRQIHDAGDETQVGLFPSVIKLTLPEATTALRFRASGPTDGGVLIDDVLIHKPGPAKAAFVETVQPVCPAFIRETFNPVLGFRIVVEGSDGHALLEGVELGFGGTTRLQDIESFKILAGTADPASRPDRVIAESSRIDEKISIPANHPLTPGEHWFWISPTLRPDASLDGRIDAAVFRIKAGGAVLEPAVTSPEGSQQIGYAVRLPGDDGSKSYRIPGMALSNEGTLIAVYDIRYDNAADLPANIDVGVSRSSDGGQSWGPMIVAMNMGNDPKHRFDGVGDPAVLVDPQTGRIWLAALWSHGNRAWNGSGPGMTPEETGQLVLAHSDDDGKTWSDPINITAQVKDPAWRLLLNGPGAGIALRDGTLVFAAQYRAADGPPHEGKPFSTLIHSQDRGETWRIGSGVKIDTTEAQIAELADGSIMINCRDNRGGSRTVAVTRDLGETWELHPTDRSALRESVCMASLLATDHPRHGRMLWFSNPDTTRGRHSMTVKLSTDQGMTWPETHHRLYDSRNGFGYSCLAPIGNDHIGVLYEGINTMYFLRFPVSRWLD